MDNYVTLQKVSYIQDNGSGITRRQVGLCLQQKKKEETHRTLDGEEEKSLNENKYLQIRRYSKEGGD